MNLFDDFMTGVERDNLVAGKKWNSPPNNKAISLFLEKGETIKQAISLQFIHGINLVFTLH